MGEWDSIKDTNNKFSISSGELQQASGAAVGDYIALSDGITMSAGDFLYIHAGSSFGFCTGGLYASPPVSTLHLGVYNNAYNAFITGLFSYLHGDSGYKSLFVLRPDGGYYVIDQNKQLVTIADTNVSGTKYLGIRVQSNIYVQTYYSIAVGGTLGGGYENDRYHLATDYKVSATAGNQIDHESDCTINWVTSNTNTEVKFRIVDSLNYWTARYTGLNNIKLIEVNGGVETVRSEYTSSTAGSNFSITCVGTAIKLWRGAWERISYTSSSHQSGNKAEIVDSASYIAAYPITLGSDSELDPLLTTLWAL